MNLVKIKSRDFEESQYLILFFEDAESKCLHCSCDGHFPMGTHLIYWLLKFEGLLVLGVSFMWFYFFII